MAKKKLKVIALYASLALLGVTLFTNASQLSLKEKALWDIHNLDSLITHHGANEKIVSILNHEKRLITNYLALREGVTTCSELKKLIPSVETGIYRLNEPAQPHSPKSYFCEFDSNGKTIAQTAGTTNVKSCQSSGICRAVSPQRINIRLSSRDYKKATQRLPGFFATTPELIKQHSKSACIFNETYGFDINSLWVDKGCRAEFSIAFLPHAGFVNLKKVAPKFATDYLQFLGDGPRLSLKEMARRNKHLSRDKRNTYLNDRILKYYEKQRELEFNNSRKEAFEELEYKAEFYTQESIHLNRLRSCHELSWYHGDKAFSGTYFFWSFNDDLNKREIESTPYFCDFTNLLANGESQKETKSYSKEKIFASVLPAFQTSSKKKAAERDVYKAYSHVEPYCPTRTDTPVKCLAKGDVIYRPYGRKSFYDENSFHSRVVRAGGQYFCLSSGEDFEISYENLVHAYKCRKIGNSQEASRNKIKIDNLDLFVEVSSTTKPLTEDRQEASIQVGSLPHITLSSTPSGPSKRTYGCLNRADVANQKKATKGKLLLGNNLDFVKPLVIHYNSHYYCVETDSGFSPTDDQKVAAYLFSNEVNKDLAPFRVKRIQGSLKTTPKNWEIPAQLLKNFPLKTFPLSGYKKQKESRASQREEKRKSRKQKMEKMFRKLSKEKDK